MTKKLWLISPTVDLISFFSIFWTAPIFLLLKYFYSVDLIEVLTRNGPYLVASNVVHLCVPIVFSMVIMRAGESLRRKTFLRHSVTIAVLVPIAVWLSFSFRFILVYIIPTITAGWATWHFYRQDLGILSLYRLKQNNVVHIQVLLDRAICLVFSLLNPIQYWLRNGYRFRAFDGKIDLTWADGILPWIWVRYAGAGFFVLYIIVQLRYRSLLTPRSLFASLLFAQFISMTNLFFVPFFVEYFIRLLHHNISEFTLQVQLWKNQNAIKAISRSQWALSFAALAFMWIIIFSISRFPFIWRINAEGAFSYRRLISSSSPELIAGLIAGFVVIHWLHFLSGRYTYNFGDPHIRKLLKF